MAKKKQSPEDMLTKVTKQVEKFLMDTEEARIASERDRDYRDHKQWTDAEIAKLRARKQAPIVVNRIKSKVDGLLGLLSLRNTDPKAYPRTRKHENAAEAITDCLRFVADNNDFNNTIKMDVAENVFIEGYGGAMVSVHTVNGEPEVLIEHLPWDRIYFDPHSRRRDFSDARYMGTILWMSKDEAEEKFPDVDVDKLTKGNTSAYETFEDRPRWVEAGGDRVRVALHFWKEGGKWWMCIFSNNTFLVEPQESPFLDEFGEPTNPIELVGAYIDRDNNRYGEVRGFIDQQDEINHRRSKALHLLTQRQTKARRGAIRDLAAMKRELAKPDGHIEYDGEQGDFDVLQTSDMAQGQFELYQDAKSELDAVSFNAQLAGERQSGDLSGKAIDRLQQAGTIELNGLYSAINSWEKRVYRQVHARTKQFWTEEKWIRVTDDQNNLRWVGLNAEVKAQEWMEEIINDESESLVKRKQVSASYQYLMQLRDSDDLAQAQEAENILNQIVGIKNEVPQLDVDIILEQSYDTVNVQQEQFEMLARFGQGSDIDIIELIELSQLRGKDELIDKIKERRSAASQAANGVEQMKMQEQQAKVAKIAADTQLATESAIQKKVESAILIQRPDNSPQVNT